MLFNSFQFLLFFVLVTGLYFVIRHKWRWLLLLIASYVFYASWNAYYLALIATSTLVTFASGLLLEKQNANTSSTQTKTRNKRLIVAGSLIVNFSILVFFKYYDFLAETINFVFRSDLAYSSFLLPVGISFYVFQAASYTLDVYKEKIEPQRHLGKYALFVSFFPQLVAGPIEKAANLLPQIDIEKSFDYERVRSGCLLMLWGVFKKVVVADRLGLFVSEVYGGAEEVTGLIPVIAIFFFAFQVYIDFSAYSEIAIGAALVLGFRLTINFKRPYLASSFKDFWKRWHISLNSWFFEYLYINLGGNRLGKLITTRNIIIVFLISGLWHGPSWNFIIWGGINGCFLIFLDRFLSPQKTTHSLFSKMGRGFIILTCWAVSLVFFRAETFSDAIAMYSSMGIGGVDQLFDFGLNRDAFLLAISGLVLVYVVDILQESGIRDQRIFNLPLAVRWGVYVFLAVSIIYLGAYGADFGDSSFIYFQF